MKTAKKKVISEYDQQAIDFIEATGIKIVKVYTGHQKYFDEDKKRRASFSVTIKRGNKSFNYDFGTSIMDSYEVIGWSKPQDVHRAFCNWRKINHADFKYITIKEHMTEGNGESVDCDNRIRDAKTLPSDYSLLSCMSSDSYCANTFDEWCSDYGCDNDSRKALETYLKCQKIASDINGLFTAKEIDDLQKIQ